MVFSFFLVNFCVFLIHDSGHLQIQFIDTPEIQNFLRPVAKLISIALERVSTFSVC